MQCYWCTVCARMSIDQTRARVSSTRGFTAQYTSINTTVSECLAIIVYVWHFIHHFYTVHTHCNAVYGIINFTCSLKNIIYPRWRVLQTFINSVINVYLWYRGRIIVYNNDSSLVYRAIRNVRTRKHRINVFEFFRFVKLIFYDFLFSVFCLFICEKNVAVTAGIPIALYIL